MKNHQFIAPDTPESVAYSANTTLFGANDTLCVYFLMRHFSRTCGLERTIVSQIKNLEGRKFCRFLMRSPSANFQILYLKVYRMCSAEAGET